MNIDAPITLPPAIIVNAPITLGGGGGGGPITNASVNIALAADPAASRTALGLGSAALAATRDFAAATHTHAISEITGLQTALNAKQPTGNYIVEGDVRLSDARTPTSHSHTASEITDFAEAVAEAAPERSAVEVIADIDAEIGEEWKVGADTIVLAAADPLPTMLRDTYDQTVTVQGLGYDNDNPAFGDLVLQRAPDYNNHPAYTSDGLPVEHENNGSTTQSSLYVNSAEDRNILFHYTSFFEYVTMETAGVYSTDEYNMSAWTAIASSYGTLGLFGLPSYFAVPQIYLTSTHRGQLARHGDAAPYRWFVATGFEGASSWQEIVATTDSRLSDSREWTATTVSQAEAEAGTSTTPRKWTAERVGQTAVSVAARKIETRTANFTAIVGGRYIAESAGLINITDPTGTVAGQSYEIWVGAGTVWFNVAGTVYSASRFSIRRRYNGSAWVTPAPVLSDALTLAIALSISNGGTGATTAAAARTNLGAAPSAITITTESTTARTITSADYDSKIRCTNASGCALTINNGTGVAGRIIIVRRATGAGAITFAGTATINNADLASVTVGKEFALVALDANTFDFV